jgi:hypothetical protein
MAEAEIPIGKGESENKKFMKIDFTEVNNGLP